MKFANNFRLSRKGLDRTFGEIERSIMDFLWEHGAATGRQVFKSVRKQRVVALTTVLTVLQRLVKKGLVLKIKGDLTYQFSPVCSREEFTKGVSREVMKGVMEISAGSAATSFVDILADTNPEELDRLSILIEEKKRELVRQREESH